jgi:rubrerythrin
MEQKQFEDFYDALAEQAKQEGKAEVNKLLADAKADSLEFVQQQGELMSKYLIQLALGQITRDEFKSYVTDMKTLSMMEMQRQGVAGQASIQRFIGGLTQAVMIGLFRFL